MAKRSPWAKQNRRTKKALVQKYSSAVLPEKVVDASQQFIKGITAPKQAHIDFLERNKKELAIVMGKEIKKKIPKQIFDERIKLRELDRELLADLAQDVILSIHERNHDQGTKRIRKALIDYTRSRSLPQDRELITLMAEELYATALLNGKPQINLLQFERNYLLTLKEKRNMTLALNYESNRLIKKIIGNNRVTSRQKQQLKKAFSRKFEDFQKRILNGVFSKGQTPKTIPAKQLYDQFLVDSAKELKAIYSTWIPQEKHLVQKTIPQKNSISNRNERKQQYELEKNRMQDIVEKQKTTASREKLLSIEKTAQRTGQKFDPLRFCLEEIKKENPVAGQRFQELFEKNILTPTSIRRLFDSGNLSRRVFLQAIDSGFLKEFDVREVNSLARGISFIGPKVPKNEHAIKSFQSNNSKKIFLFLKKNGLIETQHRNGGCVALHRPQTR